MLYSRHYDNFIGSEILGKKGMNKEKKDWRVTFKGKRKTENHL